MMPTDSLFLKHELSARNSLMLHSLCCSQHLFQLADLKATISHRLLTISVISSLPWTIVLRNVRWKLNKISTICISCHLLLDITVPRNTLQALVTSIFGTGPVRPSVAQPPGVSITILKLSHNRAVFLLGVIFKEGLSSQTVSISRHGNLLGHRLDHLMNLYNNKQHETLNPPTQRNFCKEITQPLPENYHCPFFPSLQLCQMYRPRFCSFQNIVRTTIIVAEFWLTEFIPTRSTLFSDYQIVRVSKTDWERPPR